MCVCVCVPVWVRACVRVSVNFICGQIDTHKKEMAKL